MKHASRSQDPPPIGKNQTFESITLSLVEKMLFVTKFQLQATLATKNVVANKLQTTTSHK